MNLAMLRMAKDGGKGKGKKGFGVRDEPKKGLLRVAFFARGLKTISGFGPIS